MNVMDWFNVIMVITVVVMFVGLGSVIKEFIHNKKEMSKLKKQLKEEIGYIKFNNRR
jgi:hypothetical protein